MERVDYIFQISDADKDGCLDEGEFTNLVRTVNPEATFNDSQLELIKEEIWNAFPEHIASNGLTLGGLKQIYIGGYANLDRDYDALMKAQKEAELAIEHVSGGRLGMAAGTRQPALADASPLPASPDIFGALATPAPATAGLADDEADIFDALQTPAPGTDDISNALAFAVRLPGVTSQVEFEAGATRRHLLAALKDSLPEGTAIRICGASPTPLGLSVGVLCCLPDGAMGGEEEAYFSAVLGAEPEQVFPHATFGDVEVLSADPKGALSGTIAACAAAEALAGASLAGAPGKVPISFAVRLADVSPAEFKRAKGEQLMAQISAALPEGASGRVVDVAPAAGGCVAVVAAAVNASAAKQAQHFIRKLRHEPASVLDPKYLGSAALVAAHQPKSARPTLGLKVRLPDQSVDDVIRPSDVSSALERILPEGSSAAVRCVEDSPRGTSAIVTVAAALPANTSTAGIDAVADLVRDVDTWIPASAKAAGGPPECLEVGLGLETAFGAADGLNDLQFGIKTTAAAVPESPSRGPSIITRLFGAQSADSGADEAKESAAAQSGSPASPPVDAILAGYQRRPASSGGSSGLADAVAEINLGGEQVESAAAAAEAAAVAASPLKTDKDAPPAAVISVTAFAAPPPEVATVVVDDGQEPDQQPAEQPVAASEGDNKKAKKSGWLSRLATTLSPQKKSRSRAGAAETEDEEPLADANTSNAHAAMNLTGLEQGPRALTPWEIQQQINAKEWAVMDAHVGQLLAKLQYVLDHQGPGHCDQEVSAIQDSASLMPHWARHAAHMDIGEKLTQYKMYGAAGRSFREAAAAWPDDPLARFRLGNIHFAQREYMDASRSYFDAMQRCAEGDPLLVKIHINMGIALESQGRIDAAEREYAKAAGLAPRHPRVFKLLGSARLALGDALGAVPALKRALEINPDFADAWADLGCAHAALGDYKAAQIALDNAILLEPNHIEAHFNSGCLARQRGKFEIALKHFNHVLSLDRNHWRSWLNKAVVIAKLDSTRQTDAAACLELAMQLSGFPRELVDQVDTLQEMLAHGAHIEEINNQIAVVEERAKHVASSAAVNSSWNATLSATPSGVHRSAGGVTSGGEYSMPHSQQQQQQQQQQYSYGRGGSTVSSGHVVGPAAAAAGGVQSGATSAPASSRSQSQSRRDVSQSGDNGGSVQSLAKPAAAAALAERLQTWTPPTAVDVSQISQHVANKLQSIGLDVSTAVNTLDIPLIQALQPMSTVTLEQIWAEALDAEEELLGTGSSAANRSFTENQSRPSLGGLPREYGSRSKLVPVPAAEQLLQRIVRTHALPHLARPALNALCGRVLALMNHSGSDAVDLSLLLCVLAALVDAPSRDRLDLTYKLLMWRSRETKGGKEDPITRKDLLELLATLKMVFERQHKTTYLSDRHGHRAADSQFVMYERFAAELQRFFCGYEALPVLSNPLD